MSKVVIKKKISLEFLGKDYAEGYLEFKSIPLREYDKYTEKIAETKDNENEAGKIVLEILKENFIGGKFPDEEGKLFDLTNDDLLDFDISTAVRVFKILSGQDIDPN